MAGEAAVAAESGALQHCARARASPPVRYGTPTHSAQLSIGEDAVSGGAVRATTAGTHWGHQSVAC